jgi:hypothetical protein
MTKKRIIGFIDPLILVSDLIRSSLMIVDYSNGSLVFTFNVRKFVPELSYYFERFPSARMMANLWCCAFGRLFAFEANYNAGLFHISMSLHPFFNGLFTTHRSNIHSSYVKSIQNSSWQIDEEEGLFRL